MRFRTAFSMTSRILLFCFSIWLWSAPLPMWSAVLSNAPEPSSVSGKVVSVADSQFTISLERNQNPNKLEFVIDSSTKVEGRLAVGVQASVDYRADADRLIATHVVVLPASGIQAN